MTIGHAGQLGNVSRQTVFHIGWQVRASGARRCNVQASSSCSPLAVETEASHLWSRVCAAVSVAATGVWKTVETPPVKSLEAMCRSWDVSPRDIRHDGVAIRRLQPSSVYPMAIIAIFVVLLSSDVIADVTAVARSRSSSSSSGRHSGLMSTLRRKFIVSLSHCCYSEHF